MSEIQIHPADPKRKVRTLRISPLSGGIGAALLVGAGTAVTLGLIGAPGLLSDLVRSADRLSLRETARRGAEAYLSVQRQTGRLTRQLAGDELFLARLSAVLDMPRPEGFPADAPAESQGGGELTSEVAALARRLRAAELFRRRIAAATHETSRADAARLPARSPVEPSVAVPVARFGPHPSPVTQRPEFFAGLALAAPEGTTVIAPGDATVLFAGPVPSRLGAAWRPLGTVVVLSHDARTVTLYGHLQKALVRARQRVRRGDPIGRVGRSGFAPAPRLHYEVRRLEGERWVARDPRLFVLDAEWITAAEVRTQPRPPAGDDLPPVLR